MKPEYKSITSLTGMAMATLLLLFASATYSQPNNRSEQTIQYLINRIANSDMIFIRNNERHPANEAAKHINNKYQHFRDEIKTPEDFIEKCATKSLLSGNYYQIIDKRGNRIRTHDWLIAELTSYRKSQP